MAAREDIRHASFLREGSSVLLRSAQPPMARATTAAKDLHKEANELFKSGDYGAAAEAYTAALQQVPASQPGAEDLDPAAAKSK
eukprot:COSAG06_NODE_18422_length_888_cov_7.642586_1_plen_83_part_10